MALRKAEECENMDQVRVEIDRIDEALRFAVGLDCLDCFTIGAANRDELADLIRRIPQVSVAS